MSASYNKFATEQLKQGIKHLLKKNKMTYRDLAKKLKCSEPTIKRVLGEEELTLSRLLQICEILDVSLSDLDQFTKTNQRDEWILNEKQQQFLADNPHFFSFLFEMFQKLTPEQIAEKHKISSRALQKYLIGLEKMDLIKANSAGELVPFSKVFPSLNDGPLGVAYFRSFIQNTSAFFIDVISDQIMQKRRSKAEALLKTDSDKKGSRYSVQAHLVRPDTYKKYMDEIEKIHYELEKTSLFEEKTYDKKELKTCVINMARTIVENDNPNLKRINNALGDIKEI